MLINLPSLSYLWIFDILSLWAGVTTGGQRPVAVSVVPLIGSDSIASPSNFVILFGSSLAMYFLNN